jgi:hypothetical protein
MLFLMRYMFRVAISTPKENDSAEFKWRIIKSQLCSISNNTGEIICHQPVWQSEMKWPGLSISSNFLI